MHKMIRIEWEDSSSSSRIWNTVEKLKSFSNARCISVGFLVHEDDTCVVIAGHKGEEDYAGEMRIPKRSIVKRRVWKEK